MERCRPGEFSAAKLFFCNPLDFPSILLQSVIRRLEYRWPSSPADLSMNPCCFASYLRRNPPRCVPIHPLPSLISLHSDLPGLQNYGGRPNQRQESGATIQCRCPSHGNVRQSQASPPSGTPPPPFKFIPYCRLRPISALERPPPRASKTTARPLSAVNFAADRKAVTFAADRVSDVRSIPEEVHEQRQEAEEEEEAVGPLGRHEAQGVEEAAGEYVGCAAGKTLACRRPINRTTICRSCYNAAEGGGRPEPP